MEVLQRQMADLDQEILVLNGQTALPFAEQKV